MRLVGRRSVERGITLQFKVIQDQYTVMDCGEPNDKVITLLSVKRFGTRGRIPVGETDKSLAR